MSRTPFDAGREQDFADAWESGRSTADLGAVFGVCPAAVSALAKARGFTPRRPGRPAKPEEPDALTGGSWQPDGGIMRWVRTG